jgi:TRAP-type transport system small permease protein
VSAVAGWFGRLYAALALAGAWLLLAMVLLICLNIALRNAGLGVVAWTEEVSEYALYAITLLAAPWLLRRGFHVRVDVLATSLPPRLGWAAEALADLVGLAVCLGLAWYGAAATAAAHEAGALSIKGLVFPEWWLLAPLPAAFALLALEFGFRLDALLRGPRRPTRRPAGGLA